jgi:hypothetical protein
MSISLRADNRILTKDAKYSYLLDNYSSGLSTFSVMNTEGFYINNYILVGNVGSENSEILQIESVTPSTGAITFKNFSDNAAGSGISTVTISNGGAGYTVGDILTVTQGTAVGGKVWVTGVLAGSITSVSVTQAGAGYTVAAGLATTGGTGAGCLINITAITTAVSATSIIFDKPHSFIANQPVTVMVGNSNTIRGTGTVLTTVDNSTTMTLYGVGVVGTTYGDLIRVGDLTKFAHSESTRVTVISYNKVRFFRTDTPSVPNSVAYTSLVENQNKSITEKTVSTITAPPTTTYTKSDDPSFITTVDYTPPIVFEGATALTDPMNIAVNEFYSVFLDTINNTGYGWFAFYNETTKLYSVLSNPIPYAGFPENTVRKAFEAFDSSLNTKELKLITQTDRYNWLNEALASMTNELNLGNWEFFSSEELTLTLKAGQSKYLLPQDFSDLLFINDSQQRKMESYAASFQRPYTATYMRYLVRGKYLIFDPAPETDSWVTIAYLKSSPIMKNLDDVLDLPNNAFYAIKDFMRYRAYQKLGNTNESNNSFAAFGKQIDNMKIYAIKRDDGLDSWSINESSNV